MSTTQIQRDDPATYFNAMVKIATDMGCQLEPITTNRTTLRGLCPFHKADNLANAHTLKIDARNARYWCNKCQVKGNPIAFAAEAWGVSAFDARMLLSITEDPTAARPPYPEQYHANDGAPPTPQFQNTALLTRATRYYAQQLTTHYEPLHFLALLGIHPDSAIAAGIGYSPGTGLRQYLLDHGITENETANSPLFHHITGTENYKDSLTISDRDFTKATLWITNTHPNTPPNNNDWGRGRPVTRGIAGRKSTVVNLYALPTNCNAVITDDIRTYMVLSASHIPSAVLTHRRRNINDIQEHATRLADIITARKIKKAALVMHDGDLANRIADRLANTLGQENVNITTKDQILQLLDPRGRDLDLFKDQLPQDRGHRSSRPNPLSPEPQDDPAPQPEDRDSQRASEDRAQSSHYSSYSEATGQPPSLASQEP